MSYVGSKSDAVAAISSVELSDTKGSSGTSPVRSGASSPGGAASSIAGKAAGATQTVGRLRAGIKTPITKTDSLRRQG